MSDVWLLRTGILIAGVLLVIAMLLAERFGLVTLIARGYRGLAYVLIAVYVVPLLTYGVWRLWQRRAEAVPAAP